MFLDKLYAHGNVINAALNAASVRNEVINNNIANNDVPGYKAKQVDFEDALNAALERKSSTGVLDLSDVTPTVRFRNENYDYRIDGNSVDIELEMVNLYQNSVKFDALINCVQNNSKRLNLAITGR